MHFFKSVEFSERWTFKAVDKDDSALTHLELIVFICVIEAKLNRHTKFVGFSLKVTSFVDASIKADYAFRTANLVANVVRCFHKLVSDRIRTGNSNSNEKWQCELYLTLRSSMYPKEINEEIKSEIERESFLFAILSLCLVLENFLWCLQKSYCMR